MTVAIVAHPPRPKYEAGLAAFSQPTRLHRLSTDGMLQVRPPAAARGRADALRGVPIGGPLVGVGLRQRHDRHNPVPTAAREPWTQEECLGPQTAVHYSVNLGGQDGRGHMDKVNLSAKLSLITEYWRPKVVGALNGQEVKLAKFQGTFVWHHHDQEDELFLGVHGRFIVEFRDHSIEIGPGEFLIVPRGVEHRTRADEEAHVLLFEPAATRNTGNVTDATFTAPNSVRL